MGARSAVWLIAIWRRFRDEPCRWCLRSAPYLAGFLAYFHQVVLRWVGL